MVHEPKVAVVVDSSSCLPPWLLESWHIYVVPHELVIEDRSLRDGIDIEPTEFYQLLQRNQKLPTTSSPKPAAFLETYRSVSAVAKSLVCITLSANFTSTHHSACVAAGMAQAELPCLQVEVVDSRAAAGAQGLISLEAAKTAQNGGSMEEVLSRVEELIPQVNLLAFLDTLYYLRRSGRVPRVAAWAGSLLDIKPLTELKLGEAKVVDKPRTRARAMERLVSLMKGRVLDRPVHVNVMHAHAFADAERLCEQVEAQFNCQEIFISEFTPVMGAHLGPGLLGLAFYTDA